MGITGQLDTVGRGQRPRTLQSGKTNQDEDNNEEDPGLDKDEDEEGTDNASMGAEAPTPYLQAIMASIQALALTVMSLKIYYTGGQP